jgi:HEAT repeat protein
MPFFPELAETPLWSLFRDFDAPHPPAAIEEDDWPEWYAELAMQIAKSGKHGLEFLLSHAAMADVTRLRAILISLAFLSRRPVPHSHTRSRIKQMLLGLLGHPDPIIIANVIDDLGLLDFAEELDNVWRLRDHPSPYVVGSVLRFLSRHYPEKARPLLEQALTSPEYIIRENGVDELDELGCVESLPKLRQLLDDPHPHVRQAAQTAVANLEELQQTAN